MIDARAALLAAATLLGYACLALAGSVSTLPPVVPALAAVLFLAAWMPGWSAAGAVLVVTVVLLFANGSNFPATLVVAPVCGALLLAVVVLLHLTDQAAGASPATVRRALARLAPGLAAGVGAGVVVSLVGALASGRPGSTSLTLAAPWLMLVAVLVGLGIGTRRGFWATLPLRRDLSGTTRRYLERARRREEE